MAAKLKSQRKKHSLRPSLLLSLPLFRPLCVILSCNNRNVVISSLSNFHIFVLKIIEVKSYINANNMLGARHGLKILEISVNKSKTG